MSSSSVINQSVFQNVKGDPEDKRRISFTLSPTRVTYANTLRRAIRKNSTPMSNEMLADRIGLLPIAMPKKHISAYEKKSILFRLNVKNETDDFRYVTASDFECLEFVPGEEEPKRIPNTNFFYPNKVTGETCLLAVLKPMIPGQEPEEIDLDAYATLGIGREHARFNPTSQCSYGYTKDSDPKRVKELWLNWLSEQKKVDPAELEKDEERKAVLEKEFRTLQINRCYLVDLDGEPYSYDFTIESVGTMSPYSIVAKALDALIILCNKYATMDKGDLPENVEIRPADARLVGYDFWFTNEDHTLGNMLQTWIVDNKVGRGPEEGGVSFAGYKIPQPLRPEMVLRVGVEDGEEKTARGIVAEAARGCAEMFKSWRLEFTKNIQAVPQEDVTPEAIGEEPLTPWEAHVKGKLAASKKK